MGSVCTASTAPLLTAPAMWVRRLHLLYDTPSLSARWHLPQGRSHACKWLNWCSLIQPSATQPGSPFLHGSVWVLHSLQDGLVAGPRARGCSLLTPMARPTRPLSAPPLVRETERKSVSGSALYRSSTLWSSRARAGCSEITKLQPRISSVSAQVISSQSCEDNLLYGLHVRTLFCFIYHFSNSEIPFYHTGIKNRRRNSPAAGLCWHSLGAALWDLTRQFWGCRCYFPLQWEAEGKFLKGEFTE